MPPIHNTEEEKTTAATTTAAAEKFKYSTCVRFLFFVFSFISFPFLFVLEWIISVLNDTTERKVSRHHHHHLLKTYTYINASKRSLSSNERNDIVIIILRVNNSALEFPFATKEKGEIVFNSIHVDPPINTSRTTKDLRLEEKIIRAKITAIDARSLRSAVVGLIDSIALVVETVERCER